MSRIPVRFRTPRILVRDLDRDDVEDLVRVYGDREAMRWVGDGEPLDREGCLRWVDATRSNYATRGYGMFALVLREGGGVFGFCGLVHPGGRKDSEIKYALRRDHWGRGLATEAVRGMLSFASRDLGLAQVVATVAPDNRASIRVLEKAGMTRESKLRNPDGSATLLFSVSLVDPASSPRE